MTDTKTTTDPCQFPSLYDRGECCGHEPCLNLNRQAAQTTAHDRQLPCGQVFFADNHHLV